MAGLIMNGEFVRRRMKELGLRQKDLAEAMGLPQSAISNIIQGKRRIKVEEADLLYPILGEDQQNARDLPVLPMAEVQYWQSAREITRLLAHYSNSKLAEDAFIVELDAGDEGVLSGLIHAVVDTGKRSLFSGGLYLVEAEGTFRFYRYLEAPARLKPMPPFQNDPTLEVGQGSFRVIGEVQGVFKRPDVLPPYGDG